MRWVSVVLPLLASLCGWQPAVVQDSSSVKLDLERILAGEGGHEERRFAIRNRGKAAPRNTSFHRSIETVVP
jgi:hypothetical protein